MKPNDPGATYTVNNRHPFPVGHVRFHRLHERRNRVKSPHHYEDDDEDVVLEAHGHQQPTHHLSVCTMNCKSNQLLRWPSATARKNPDMKPVDSQCNRLPKDRGLPQIITCNGQSQDPRLRLQGHLGVSSKPRRFPEQNPACRPCSHVCVCAPGSPGVFTKTNGPPQGVG